MAMKVEVASKEIIKPSTPTPLHLKHLKLSLLDQYIPAIPVSAVHFYSAGPENQKRLAHLKASLSVVLSDFYPLAGRMSGNQFIDCNDKGINFVETQVNASLSHVVSHPEASQLSQLLYGLSDELVSIQANKFQCGGLAIAVRMSHKLGDASSLCSFLYHWAVATRGDSNIVVCPKFDTASIFFPEDGSPSIPPVTPPTQTLASRRFVFNAGNIAALKANIISASAPTRVEAVIALIWRCAMNVSVKSGSVVNLAVNLRGRMVPPLPNFWFGNIALLTLATSNAESKPELQCLVGQLREAIRKVDRNYSAELNTHDGFWGYLGTFSKVYQLYGKGELELYNISSWCSFPFYTADFGWGKPIWTTSADIFTKNTILLMDTKCGQGVEAWVTLDEEDMARFQCEPDLIAFTSTSATPLID